MNIYYVCGKFNNGHSIFSGCANAYVISSSKDDAIAFFKKRYTNGLTRVDSIVAYQLMEVKDGLMFGIGETGNMFIIEHGK